MSPEMLAALKPADDAPVVDKARYTLQRFLIHHNKLDGFMAYMAVGWGFTTLVFPGFWYSWPVTVKLAEWTGGWPSIVSWSLLLAGIGSYVSRRKKWNRLRAISALVAFSNWATLCALFISVTPMFSPGVACYGGLASAKLMSFIHHFLRLDMEARHVDPG